MQAFCLLSTDVWTPCLSLKWKYQALAKEIISKKHLIKEISSTYQKYYCCVVFQALSLAKKTDLSIIWSSDVNLCGRAWCFHELVMKEPFLFLSPPCGKLKDENELSKYDVHIILCAASLKLSTSLLNLKFQWDSKTFQIVSTSPHLAKVSSLVVRKLLIERMLEDYVDNLKMPF